MNTVSKDLSKEVQIEAACGEMVTAILGSSIRGMSQRDREALAHAALHQQVGDRTWYLHFSRGARCELNLSLSFQRVEVNGSASVKDGEENVYRFLALRTSVTVSSTERSAMESLVYAELQREVALLAAELESTFNRQFVVQLLETKADRDRAVGETRARAIAMYYGPMLSLRAERTLTNEECLEAIKVARPHAADAPEMPVPGRYEVDFNSRCYVLHVTCEGALLSRLN